MESIADKIQNVDYRMLELLYNDTRKKFRAMRLGNNEHDVSLIGLKKVVALSHVPMVLTSTRLFGEREELPHWVVLTGYSDDSWYINNPLAKSADTRITKSELQENFGYRGTRCAVVIRGLRRKRMARKDKRGR